MKTKCPNFYLTGDKDWVTSKSTTLRLINMNSNTGDESRSDIEARIDRILRESDTRATTAEPRQPVASVTPLVVSAEAPVIVTKNPAKTIGAYLKNFSDSLSKVLKHVRDWAMSLSSRLRVSKPAKGLGVFTKVASKSRDLFKGKVKKSVVVIAGGATLVVALGLTLLLNFSSVTVTSGIETTLGSSENRSVLTIQASDANQGDLLVASLGVDQDTNQEILVMGTVFSKNDQTYALYDGEVIWQITADQIRGKVLFAEATEVP